MIRIITDSASDITIEEAKELGVEVVPLHVIFGNDVFMDGVDISHDEFYKRLEEFENQKNKMYLSRIDKYRKYS